MQREAMEQEAFFRWIAWARGKYPALDLFYHIPNGGSRDKREAARMKGEGVRAGVPDLCLPVPNGTYSALYIELKSGTNTASKEQKEWIAKLNNAGNRAVVCRGWQAAVKEACEYLRIPAPEGM